MRTNAHKLKVIIADSSNYSRLVLSHMVQAQPDLEVLDTAADGFALMAALQLHQPDVVLADLDLQNRSQRYYLQQVHRENGVPVLMLLDQANGSAENFLLNELGVYDYVLKPAHKLQPKLRDLQVEILDKIRAVRKPKFVRTFSLQNHSVFRISSKPEVKHPKGIVVIGASTGGTQALEKIIARLDEKLDACVLIAVHLPAGFTASFAKRLQTLTSHKVVEGRLGTRLISGKIIVAPGGRNMVIRQCIGADSGYKIDFSPINENVYDRPSVDMLMNSVAKFSGNNALGIVLTGMGNDGTEGLRAIQKFGGVTIAQDQESSVIFGMAKSAIEKGCVTYVRSLLQIPAFINKFITDLPVADKNTRPGF